MHTPCTVSNEFRGYFNKNGEGFRRGCILFNNFLADVDFKNPVRVRVKVRVRVSVRIRVRGKGKG